MIDHGVSSKLLAAMTAVAATALTASCAVGPNFKSPAAPQTDHYTAEPLAATTASTPVAGGESQAFAIGKQLPARWWTLFESDALNHLVDESFNDSPTVVAREATLRQARENMTATKAELLPSVDGSAAATRQKISGAQFHGSPNILQPVRCVGRRLLRHRLVRRARAARRKHSRQRSITSASKCRRLIRRWPLMW